MKAKLSSGTSAGTRTYDSIVVGGGVMGLCAAYHCILEGRSTLLVEGDQIGTGASGGVLGALMSHMPDGWNAKKEFQFQALDVLPNYIEQVEEYTGMSCGYRRCGRIIPIATQRQFDHACNRLKGADQFWKGKYQMQILDPDHVRTQQSWPGIAYQPLGFLYDNFAARINPKPLLDALAAFVGARGYILTGQRVEQVDAGLGCVQTLSGEKYHAGEIIVANGVDAYRLMQPYLNAYNDGKPIGRGVKGQAVLVQLPHGDDLPIIYDDGVYIVPHAHSLVGVGSSSHNQWQDDQWDDHDLAFWQKAQTLVPALRNAPIVAKFVGIRPRNTLKGMGADPWFGPVPNHPNLIALMGGFKISFGIAHLAMEVARGRIAAPSNLEP